ncbi:MAG: hypothetical protein C0616_09450 [Desulfuromonas sp.]|nr:MAG: hypothetical protein C0616_09450 [Desulfuromonas sp.]
MQAHTSCETLDENEDVAALRSAWFQRIDHLQQIVTENAGLECATRCTARCCPKSTAIQDPAQAVGHVAIMLPFEREYLLAKTGIPQEKLQYAPLELSPDVNIGVGFITSAKPCPFLTADHGCSIHAIRPLDCRSFPLIPFFCSDGSIAFRVDIECPSAKTISAAFQARLMEIWRNLLPDMPMSYRMLYNKL